MSIISIPFTFSPGGTIISSQVNSCLSTIYNDYNGSIGNSNLSSSVVISNSKLAQLTQASLVSGTSLTGLASTPSGAGVIPIANIPTIPSSQVSGSFLGTWSTKAITTIFQAATDGFVVAYTVTGYLISIYTDSSATPTTLRMAAQSPNQSAVMCPVRKNDYYQVTVSSSGAGTVYFLPLGS